MPIFDVFSPKMKISTLRFFYTKLVAAISLKFRYMFNQLSKKIPRNFLAILASGLGARFFRNIFPKSTRSILAQKGVIFCPLWRGRVPSLINIFSIWFLHLIGNIVEFLCVHGTLGLRVVVLELLTIQNVGRVSVIYVHAMWGSWRTSDMSPLWSTGKWCVAVSLGLGLGFERDMGMFMNTWPCPKEVKWLIEMALDFNR